jgi:cytosine/adenosine deaminase-related metal-dependent hydrolase
MPTHRAAWIFPVEGPPLTDGVLIVTDGKIVALESYRGQTIDRDHGDAVLLPGLVNAHVHLDLGGLQGKLPPPRQFTDWLQQVIAYRRSAAAEEIDAAIASGIQESLRQGTTLVGDIAAGGRSAGWLRASPLRSVVYYELIGLSQTRGESTWSAALGWLGQQAATDSFHLGLSPHAPYTVGRWLFEQVVTYACHHGLPLAMHLGETTDEWPLLEQHTGPLRAFLQSLGVWDAASLLPGMQAILSALALHQPSLLAHGNYFTSETFPLIGSSVVYCPRTHAYFGHPAHPFRELLQAGVNVALGTDSLASNPDLSLWEEMRFLARQYPELSGENFLRMGTLNGARALGFDQITGSLVPGKAADFLVVGSDKNAGADLGRLLRGEAPDMREVYIAGKQV